MIPKTLPELTRWVLKHKETYVALALHPFMDQTERMALEQLMFENKRSQLFFASAHYTPESILDRLPQIAQTQQDNQPSQQLINRILKNPNTPSKTLEKIYADGCKEEQLALIASHRNAPVEVLETLDWRKSKRIRRALCCHSGTPLDMIKRILPASDSLEKKYLVKHPLLDHAVLQTLWNGADVFLRAEVAAHPNCPPELLKLALENSETLIRKRLAANPVLDDVSRRCLLKDPDPQVRAALVKNLEVSDSAFSDDELLSLCEDPSPQVRRHEAKRTELSKAAMDQLAADDDPWVKRWLARNTAVPKATLLGLADDDDDNIRRAVTRNPACSEQILISLADDPSSWVRAGVAMREELPLGEIKKLSTEQNVDVLSALGRNPSTPEEILDEIAQNDNRDVRRSVILNRAATAETLKKLQDDPYPLNRIILAGRKKCDQKTRWTLVNDPEPEVRFSATRAYAKELSML